MNYWTDEPKPDKPMKPRRNEPCPCNSGRKYKRCCGKRIEERRTAIRQEAWKNYRDRKSFRYTPCDTTGTSNVPVVDRERTDDEILANGQNFDKQLAEEENPAPTEP